VKTRPLHQVSVRTTIEAEDAVAELLAALFAIPPTVYTDEETKATWVSIYCRKIPGTRKRAALKTGLQTIRRSGLEVAPGRISVRQVAREDWTQSWKRHFKPVSIGSQLLVTPGWVRHRRRKNQAVVVLDPGLSFGTGNHPTTRFCLRALVAGRKVGHAQSFWDVGTGSGILAIAAAKLGYGPVEAIDLDPVAVRTARENARRNGVQRRVRVARRDLERLPREGRERYDLICANLVANVLLAQRERILNRLRPGGKLVLAGILKSEFGRVRREYARAGLKLVQDTTDGEWRSAAFVLPARVRKSSP
jgi:ribosomal protein L11 methyltransferase